MRQFSVQRMRRHNGSTRVTEMVRPEDVNVGDRVLVGFVVTQVAPVFEGSQYKHIHAQIPHGESPRVWNGGNQEIWTWGWSQASGGKIERVQAGGDDR